MSYLKKLEEEYRELNKKCKSIGAIGFFIGLPLFIFGIFLIVLELVCGVRFEILRNGVTLLLGLVTLFTILAKLEPHHRMFLIWREYKMLTGKDIDEVIDNETKK